MSTGKGKGNGNSKRFIVRFPCMAPFYDTVTHKRPFLRYSNSKRFMVRFTCMRSARLGGPTPYIENDDPTRHTENDPTPYTENGLYVIVRGHLCVTVS